MGHSFKFESRHKILQGFIVKQTGNTNKMPSVADEAGNPPEAKQVRSSSCERTLTEKGKEPHEQQAKKSGKAFNKAYDSWKQTAKDIRSKLKAFCSSEGLNEAQRDIKSKCTSVSQCYEPMQHNHTTTPEIV